MGPVLGSGTAPARVLCCQVCQWWLKELLRGEPSVSTVELVAYLVT